MRSSRVSPMPIRMPEVNGTSLLARHPDAGEARRRVLVWRTVMGLPLRRADPMWFPA